MSPSMHAVALYLRITAKPRSSLDESMGWACATAGTPGMTVSLQMRYHRPVPLEAPLRVLAHVTGSEGRKVYVAGSITTEEDPATALVAAEGVFVSPDPEHARALFPGLRDSGETSAGR